MRDFAQVQKKPRIDLVSVDATLASLEIDHEGLDATDRKILLSLIEHFSGGPVGLGTIAAMLAEEQDTVEDMYEPFLLQQGYLDRTPKGRMVTRRAYEKFGKVLPKEMQASLL